MGNDDPRRHVPRTDAVLADPQVAAAIDRLGRTLVKSTVAETLDACRRGEVAPSHVVASVLATLPPSASSLRPVINATGVVVHTNLGRAPLSDAAVEAVRRAAGATDVELDLVSGQRGRRGAAALAALAAQVPDAGAVHVVNNGAAALALTASVLARGRHLLIARGELVEIGDGFRIPELLESVSVELREVGTTNRVSLEDYARAVDEHTGFVLKVHPSNFRVEGFTSSVSIAALATLGVPVVADIGSGLLRPHPRLPEEPDATSALRAGATVVTASGDKLLGGPQCGLLLGEAATIHRLRRDPLARALRVDKLTLAALEATLCGPPPPVAEALATRPTDLLDRAERLAGLLGDLHGDLGEGAVTAVATSGRVGGGGAPGVPIPSAGIALPEGLARPLRLGEPPVVGRVHEGRLVLDLLAVPADQDGVIADAVRAAVGGAGEAAQPCT